MHYWIIRKYALDMKKRSHWTHCSKKLLIKETWKTDEILWIMDERSFKSKKKIEYQICTIVTKKCYEEKMLMVWKELQTTRKLRKK